MLQAFDSAARHGGCIFAENLVAAPFASIFLQHSQPLSRSELYSHSLRWDHVKRGFPPSPAHHCAGTTVVPRAMVNQPSATTIILHGYMRAPGLMNIQHSVSILVLRQTTRRFIRGRHVMQMLQDLTPGRRWMAYMGVESVYETLRMFGGSDTVVGYHGAGLINSIFSRAERPHVHELTTFCDLESKRRWRAYLGYAAQRWNPGIITSVQALRLEPLLLANAMRLQNVSDHTIKNLRWVKLTRSNIISIVDHLSGLPSRTNATLL